MLIRKHNLDDVNNNTESDKIKNSTRFKNLRSKYLKVSKINQELTDSIQYSKYVQQGILPHERHIKRIFSQYYILYKPSGIIGGDLYWVGQNNELKYFAVGDCTGHGPSGAMLSILGLSFLNYLLLAKNMIHVGNILTEMDKKWIESFHQGNETEYNNDWMEIGLAAFNENTRELYYSGAINKLWIIHQNTIKEIEGEKFPIGGWQLKRNRIFSTHKINLPPNSYCILFSDGIKDQFGGEKFKRFTSNRLKSLLLEATNQPFHDQLNYISSEINSWMNKQTQTDDICLFVLKL